MITLDKIKIVSSIDNATILDDERFEQKQKFGHIQSESYTSKEPYALYIELDYQAHELVLEFTGKVLEDDYPRLISKDTIRQCLQNINNLGVCKLNVEGILNDGDVCKADVSKDFECQDCKALTDELRANVSNFNKYLPRVIAGNFVIEKNVATKGCKKRLTLYDKHVESEKACNRKFLSGLKDPQSMLQYFEGKVRMELNLNSKEQIRKSLNIQDTRLSSVLESSANPIWDFVSEIVGEPVQAPTFSNHKEYMAYLVIKDNDFDLAKVYATMRQLRPGTKGNRLMAPFKAMMQKLHPESITLRSRLASLLMLEVLFVFLPFL